jgi:hypothetical protein
MVRVEGDLSSASFWAALPVDGIGRALTRDQAEAVAARTSHEHRFLLRHTEQTSDFGRPGDSVPTLAMPAGETIWTYGEPTRTDSIAVLREVMDGAVSPDPSSVLLPVVAVVARANERFGEASPHDVETHFDRLVLALGGRRTDEEPGYLVPVGGVLGIG